MKKFYVKPECTAVALPAGRLMQSAASTYGIDTGSSHTIGSGTKVWSNEFSGGIEDDTQGGSLWDEEN